MSPETIYYSKTYRRGDRAKGAPAMLQISAQFNAKLRRQDGESGPVTIRLQLALGDPFVVELIILQEDGGFAWLLAAEDLHAALRHPGRNYGLGDTRIKRKGSKKIVRVILPAGDTNSVTLWCPLEDIEQFVRLVDQVVQINGLLGQYLEGGHAAIEAMLASQ